jgi:AcrR family transcriptional regulator
MTIEGETGRLATREDDETTAVMRLLWGQRPAATRGPKATLNIDLIARTAVELADREGLDAVTMQRVAVRLKFTKMALYRHVRSRAELVAVMIEHAVGEPPDVQRAAKGWRARVVAWADALWECWHRHPWLPGATAGSRPMGPHELMWTEAAFQAFEQTTLDTDEQAAIIAAVSSYVRGCQHPTAGTQLWTAQPQVRDQLRVLLDAHKSRYTAMLAADHAANHAADHAANRADDWHRGLQYLLDGVEVLVARTPAPRGSTRRR